MSNNRSFKDYVNNDLFDKMFLAIKSYLESTDVNDLGLQLYRIEEIREVELDDIELKFVDVSDLPGSEIEFDAVYDTTIIAYDRDRYHSDESEAAHQWFSLHCRGNLDKSLSDLKVENIGFYDRRNKRQRPLSNGLVPIIKKEDLEKEAERFLRKYYKEALSQPMWINPKALVKRMGLRVAAFNITEDLSVFGQIYFQDCKAIFYDKENHKEKHVKVPKGAIVVDPDVFFQRNLGALNNTIVHECVHWDLHKKAFDLEKLFNAEASKIQCKVVGGMENFSTDDAKWMEWQANSLAPRIQMPLEMFKRKAREFIKKHQVSTGSIALCDVIQPVIEDLADFFKVSRLAAKLRMIDAGYEEAAGAFIYIDGHYVQPHSFKKGSLKPNQTYSIPAEDAAIQCVTKKEELKNYIYIDSHFIRKHSRYLYKDSDGDFQMTDYARFHMDECAVVFEISIRNREEKTYHSECYLNRDKGTPLDFNYVYVGENGEFTVGNDDGQIFELIKEEQEVFKKLTNDPTECWKIVLEWRGISQAELARRTEISEKTIGSVINKGTGRLETIVLMCLGAHLPLEFSMHIIDKSNVSIQMTNETHVWYYYALKNLYTKEIPVIRDILQQQGVTIL